jgi:hypothetical protein
VTSTVALPVSDETFVATAPELVAAVVARPERWRDWWPDLDLELSRDRGVKGCQWVLTGAIGGTAEIYLEPWHDGTLLHLFLRLELPAGSVTARGVDRATRERTLAWKVVANRLKDELEAGRAPGEPATPPSP